MARDKINGDVCVTHTFPLEEFETALTRTPEQGELQIKVMLDPRL